MMVSEKMRQSIYRYAALGMALILSGAASIARAQSFEPDLGQAREIIAGRDTALVTIPPDAKELNVYPLKAERPRPLLTELPGRPFLPVTPMPQARAWWKYPIYVAVGLPRDLFDAFVGGLNYIPILNIPLVMGAYELIPTQMLVRDPRDWHAWPGLKMNARGHGPIDGDSWGWFPSLHTWHFTYPSQRLARQNEILNQELKQKLDSENRQIEEANAAIEIRLRDARDRALKAIQAGNGREAVYRMLAYHNSYPLDEGGFALFATAMALYIGEGPEWVGPVLWSEIDGAQPRLLAEAEKLMTATAQKFPDRIPLSEALIYTRLALGRNSGAVDAASALLKSKPDDPFRQRLVFETAMTDRDTRLARRTRAAMSPTSYDAPTRELMDLRFQMLSGQAAPAAVALASLHAQRPEDPYYAYYLACAQAMAGEKMENPAEAYRQAAALVNLAGDRAPNAALRQRSAQASTWLKSVLQEIEQKPELFSPGVAPAAVTTSTTTR